MTRRLRPLEPDDISRLSPNCGSCVFWETASAEARHCGSSCDSEALGAWFRHVKDEWGECGRVAYEDDEVLGFIKYAPSGYFPQARTFPSAPEDPSVPLIACLHVSADARHHGLGTVLLRAALRDLVNRGERRVEAFGFATPTTSLDDMPMPGMPFLLRNGFTVSKPDSAYPLLKLDLKSLVIWQENLEAVLDSLRLPLRVPKRAPASLVNGR